jgi:hypothetical protein
VLCVPAPIQFTPRCYASKQVNEILRTNYKIGSNITISSRPEILRTDRPQIVSEVGVGVVMVTVIETAPASLGSEGVETLEIGGVGYLRANSSTLGIKSPIRKGFDTTSSWGLSVLSPLAA